MIWCCVLEQFCDPIRSYLINLVTILYTCKYLTVSVLLAMGGGLSITIGLEKRAILLDRHLYRSVIPIYAPVMFSPTYPLA